MYRKRALEKFKGDIFATETTGIVIDEVCENYAKCSLEYDRKHLNAAGSVMGGAIFTLADFTFAVASNTGEYTTVSLNSQINYLSAPSGGKIFSEATCVKDGGTICIFEVMITDAQNRKVAFATFTGFKKK